MDRFTLAELIHVNVCHRNLENCEGECDLTAKEAVSAGWSKPRTVNSATEAEALAEGSVILDARGEVLHWIDRGDYLQWSDIWGNECGADYPATVLFTPGGST